MTKSATKTERVGVKYHCCDRGYHGIHEATVQVSVTRDEDGTVVVSLEGGSGGIIMDEFITLPAGGEK